MSKEIFLQQGQKLNNAFTLQEKLGEQKNSTVFKAAYQLSPEVSKEVAVKIIKLSGNQTDRETQLHQFRREAEILTFLRHQNIIPFYLHDMHTQQNRYGVDEHPYIVMEHAEEGSVRNLMEKYKNNEIEKGKRLIPISQTVDILRQTANGVQYIHNQGLLHRDIKPENLLLSRDKETGELTVWVSDFGISIPGKLSWLRTKDEAKHDPQEREGTWAYTAPEQFEGNAVKESDIYAMGVTLYELLIGEVPFKGEDYKDLYPQHKNNPPPSFSEVLNGNEMNIFREALEEPTMQALAKDPAYRQRTAEQFGDDIHYMYTKAKEQKQKGKQHFLPPKIEKEEPLVLNPNPYADRSHEIHDIDTDRISEEDASKTKIPEVHEPKEFDFLRRPIRSFPGLREELPKTYPFEELKEKVISVEEKKERSKLLMNKGKNLVVEGKAKEALPLYNEAIILNPENSEAHNHKGFVLDEVGQYEEALFHYNAAININPNYSIAYNNKGVTLKKLKRYDEAIEMYKQAQYLDPHNPNIQRNIQKAQELFSQEIKQKSKDFVERGKELQTEKKYDEALPYFTEAGELDPVNEDAFFGKGYALGELGKHKEAIIAYDRVLELNPYEGAAWNNKGNSLDSLGKYDDAIHAYDKAISIYPTGNRFNNKGSTLENQGKLSEAFDHYEKALKLNPNDEIAESNKNRVNGKIEQKKIQQQTEENQRKSKELEKKADKLIGDNKNEEGLKAANEALELDKENYGAWYSKANVLERLERDKEALAAWEKASVSYTVAAERHITNIKQKLQKQEQKEQSRKKFQEGKDFENKKEYTKALTIYEEVTKLNPENEDAFFRKGLLLHKLEKYQDAISVWNELIQLDPRNSFAWHNKGVAFYNLSNYLESIKAEDQAIKIDSTNSYAWNGKAVIFEKIKNLDEALYHIRKASELEPSNEMIARNQNRIEKAIEEQKIQQQKDADKIMGRNLWWKGRELLEQKNYQKGLKIIEEAGKLFPENENILFDKARALYGLGKYEETVRVYDEYLKLDKKSSPAWNNKGLALRYQGKFKEALSAYNRALEYDSHMSNSDKIQCFQNKGKVLQELERYEAAIQIYNEGLQVESGNPKNKALKRSRTEVKKLLKEKKKKENPPLINRRTFVKTGVTLAVALTGYQGLRYAVDKYDEHQEQQESKNFADGMNLLTKGNTLLEQKQYEKALQAFDQSLQLIPKNENAFLGKGVAFIQLKKYQEAINAYDEVIKVNPKNSSAFLNRGYSFSELGKYRQAIKDYTEAIKINPKDDQAFTNKGISLIKLNQYQEAIQNFDQAIEINSSNSSAYFGKGNALEKTHKYKEALIAYQKATELDLQNSDAFFGKGNMLMELDRYREALIAYDQVIILDPQNSNAFANRAFSFNKLGEYKEALKSANQAIELDHDNENAFFYKGYALSDLGNYSESIQAYNEVIRLNPQNSSAWNNKGSAFEELGRNKEALQAYKKALELDSSNEYAKRNLKRLNAAGGL